MVSEGAPLVEPFKGKRLLGALHNQEQTGETKPLGGSKQA